MGRRPILGVLVLVMPQGKSAKLDGVQFGRAVAAILVAFYHAGRMLALPQYLGSINVVERFFAFGDAGVDFFFTLSGFIIYYVHQSDIGRPSRFWRYIWRRLARIYPMYWVATAVIIIVVIAKGKFSDLDPAIVIRSLTLAPSLQDPLLDVGWTLTHEVLFYAVFAIAIVSRAIGRFVALIWMLFILEGLWYHTDISLLRFIQNPYHIEFALGILSAMALKKCRYRLAGTSLSIGIFSFAITPLTVDAHWIESGQVIGRFLYGGASALILYGVAAMEIRQGWKFPRWAAFLGAASYSVYLFHVIFTGWLARALFHFASGTRVPELTFIVITIGAIAAGCVIYKTVEIPLQASIRNIGKRRDHDPHVKALDSPQGVGPIA